MSSRITLSSLIILLNFLLSVHVAGTAVKLTNVVCDSYNKTFVTFQHCRLKAVRRDSTVLNVRLTIHYPIDDIQLRLQILRRANGWKPWLTDLTTDFCKFMRKNNHPIVKLVFDIIKDYSNINHSCPYVGEQIVHGLYVDPNTFKLPMPTGDYAAFLTWIYDQKPLFFCNVYLSFVEDLKGNKERIF